MTTTYRCFLVFLFFILNLPISSAIRPDEAMKKKSEHAQSIFKYLAVGDLAKVQSEAAAIEKLLVDENTTGRPEKYLEYGKELLRIVRTLKDTAAKQNFTGSYYEFSKMSAVCFTCHEHLRAPKADDK